ncbi:hypothetical protein C8F04DRAFT_1263965 [Mycena alexandri]|uniref:Uncharacterized protein n=1 Tax=Mycena alexandri TaxID=1745969 RepID=A0AAD6X0M0_9AGAR|nr:hypothetical protein C8F04DRAFT_1263965 [Mycena alexandri]
MIPLARRELVRRVVRPSLVRQYASKEPNPQLGDYPELPNVSAQYRNPLGWQDKLLRRNFGDTLHHHEEINSMWGPDIPVTPPHIALRQFGIAAGCFVAAGLFIRAFLVPDRPAIPREYPFNGLETELGGHKANPEAESSDE